MRHDCEHCDTPYEIDDAKVAGRFVKVRCTRCGGTMHVVGVDLKSAPAEKWWCAFRGQPKGPFSREEVLLFIDLGDVSARTRLWKPGMGGWERICESPDLSWAYMRVVERLSADELLRAREPTRSFDPFANAALMSDGNGWFPDPTLKSGIFILDDKAQQQLQKLAETGVLHIAPARSERMNAASALLAAAGGAAMAVGGFAWLIAERLI